MANFGRVFSASGAMICAALMVVGCGGFGARTEIGGSSPTRSVATTWNDQLLEALRRGSKGPTVGSRTIALTQTAMFDAWAAYDQDADGTQLGDSLRRPIPERSEENKKEAISYAAFRVMSELFPERSTQLRDQMVALGFDPDNTSTDTSTPAGIGNTVAEALMASRRTDGSNQLNNYADTTGYAPVNPIGTLVDPDRWQQYPFLINGTTVYRPFLTPHWGGVRPFALSSGAQFRPGPPPAYGTPECTEMIEEVAEITQDLDTEKKVIAEYWADGPSSELPPGHWVLFTRWVAERDQLSLDEEVKLYFAVGNAVMDAGIAAWETKRFYDNSRPITLLRHFYGDAQIPWYPLADGTTQTIRGRDWKPYQPNSFITPPFAEYVSGHSTFSAAAAEVLRSFTGSDVFGFTAVVPAGFSKVESNFPPAPVSLSFSTFSEAADQAGISRLYGGIHFRPGDQEGRRLGRRVGAAVWQQAQRYINGTANP